VKLGNLYKVFKVNVLTYTGYGLAKAQVCIVGGISRTGYNGGLLVEAHVELACVSCHGVSSAVRGGGAALGRALRGGGAQTSFRIEGFTGGTLHHLGDSVRALEVIGADGMGHVAVGGAGAWVYTLAIDINGTLIIAIVPLAGSTRVLRGQAIPAGQVAGAVSRIKHLVAIRFVDALPAGGLGVRSADAAAILEDIAHAAQALHQFSVLADQILIAIGGMADDASLGDAALAGAILHAPPLTRST